MLSISQVLQSRSQNFYIIDLIQTQFCQLKTMSNISPQRCLNRQSIYPSSTTQINFISSLRFQQVLSLLQKNLPLCQVCKLKLKNHYCMEPQCLKKTLLCINCDIKSIKGSHYLHDFTYLIPLFSENVFSNFYRLKENFNNFYCCISEQILKINKYLGKLQKIKTITQKQLDDLEVVQKISRSQEFTQELKEFAGVIKKKKELETFQPNQILKLQNIFKGVRFFTEDECLQKQEAMRKQLMNEIEKLNWLQNPQKILTELLKQNQANFSLNLLNEPNRDIFISSKKKISINQIDGFFRYYNELFTQNLQHHKIQVKIEPELLNKSKFYQAFIYHFRQCEKLLIDNANISHLKTPLNFRKLKELEFNCNVQTDSIAALRIQNQNQELESFTIRKFREEDIKILKNITSPCKKLKNLHIQFFNKSDLSHSKQLIEYLVQESDKDLNKFVLKIRTENEVKRLYGYLSKFYRQTVDLTVNLNQAIIELLKKNPNLTKVVIQGTKNIDSHQVLQILFEMKFLMDYRIYYQNIDLMTELDNQLNKALQVKTERKKRMFASLTKMSKDKNYPSQILHTIGEQFLV